MDHVSFEVEDRVGVITLDRPEALNAISDTMEQELVEAFDVADRTDEVRAVVLTGAGRAFCAGMDLADPATVFSRWRTSPDAPEHSQYRAPGQVMPLRRDGGGRIALRMFELHKPIVAAINGDAVGGGLTMTLPADVRVAAEDARLGFVFTRRGLVPEACSSWFLPRIVNPSRALEWMLSGRLFDASEAREHGLLHAVHPTDTVLPAAMEIARGLTAETSPVSVALTRRMLWTMLTVDHPMRAHEIETDALNRRGLSNDAREGLVSFVERRDALFTDTVAADLPDVLSHLPARDFTPPHRHRPS